MMHVYGDCMLYESETWSLKREHELALHRTEMRIIRWMCGVKLRNKLSCSALRQWLEIEDIIKWSKEIDCDGIFMDIVIRKDYHDWVKKCVTLEAGGTDKEVGSGKHGKRLWTRMWMICA